MGLFLYGSWRAIRVLMGPFLTPESDQPLVIGTLYVHKWAVKRLEDPETITVTIAPASPAE